MGLLSTSVIISQQACNACETVAECPERDKMCQTAMQGCGSVDRAVRLCLVYQGVQRRRRPEIVVEAETCGRRVWRVSYTLASLVLTHPILLGRALRCTLYVWRASRLRTK